MRKNAEWADVPVIVLTAKELTPEDRARLNGHVEKVLRKGAVGQEDILQEVRRLVAPSDRHPAGDGGIAHSTWRSKKAKRRFQASSATASS